MVAYVVARVEVLNSGSLKAYQAKMPEIISKFGGKFIARGSVVETLEGPEESRRMIIIEFPSMDVVNEFFNSEEYAEAKALREGSAIAEFVAIEGV